MGAPSREPLFAYRRTAIDIPMAPARSALLLVDLQYGSASDTHGYGRAYRELGYADLHDKYISRIRKTVIPAVRRLQAAFRRVGAPVIFLTVGSAAGDFSDMAPRFVRGAKYWRGHSIEPPYARPGSRDLEVLDEIAPRAGEVVLFKTGASGFTLTNLKGILLDHRIQHIAIGGVATAYCVESTLRDATDLGFDVTLVEDACADVTPEAHARGVESCSAFSRVVSSDQVVTEILAKNGQAPT